MLRIGRGVLGAGGRPGQRQAEKGPGPGGRRAVTGTRERAGSVPLDRPHSHMCGVQLNPLGVWPPPGWASPGRLRSWDCGSCRGRGRRASKRQVGWYSVVSRQRGGGQSAGLHHCTEPARGAGRLPGGPRRRVSAPCVGLERCPCSLCFVCPRLARC